MISVFGPESFSGPYRIIEAGFGCGRYNSGSGVGAWLVLIVPVQVPLPLVPGEPPKLSSPADTLPPPTALPASGAVELTISGAPTTDTVPPPLALSDELPEGSRIRMPSLS